jgi:radical SAM protein with 4Fe4S-binding SPASM domain
VSALPLRGRPKSCAWEITLACNAACVHCGSSAGAPRSRELDTTEALALVDALADLGLEKVTLSGGEPLLRRDWPLIAEHLRAKGVACGMITNGLLVAERADEIAATGFRSVGFSVDGPPEIHDALRAVDGCFSRLMRGAEALVARGVRIGAVTQVNTRNASRLEELHDLLVANGFSGWQVQLTMPHGRAAAGGDALCLRPADLPGLEGTLIALRARTPLFLQAADNFGYMSRSEAFLRAGTRRADRFFAGCGAGISTIGVTSDGTIRGCLSLPSACDEGNIRDRPLADIWNDPAAFAYNRSFDPASLTGVCRGCTFAKICRGGCRSLVFAHRGALGENAHCLHALGRTA